ncbi:MAG: hypothetical protein EZS28_013313, partial [Streblomastix strix]
VIGGVQGIYGFPSTLVVLNGKAAFVFIVGSRLDDNEITTLTVPTRSLESYMIPSSFTFNIRNISLIIAPSPITNFTLQLASDLASVAGIQLKHRPQDLIRTASLFCHRTRLLAQAYSPTLIIDSAQLDMNQFGIVGDFEILIYQLLPNPLYKKMKQKFVTSPSSNRDPTIKTNAAFPFKTTSVDGNPQIP